MNVADRRRILGPLNAKPLQFASADGNLQDAHLQETQSGDETLYIQQGIVTNANGSAYLEIASPTKNDQHILLLASVYGPRPTRGTFSARAALSIQFKENTLEQFTAGEVKELCNFLASVFRAVINLNRYPKSGIDIFLNLIQYVGPSGTSSLEAIIPACINAIMLALIDAGIETLDTVSAGSYKGTVISFIRNGDEIVGFWADNDFDNNGSYAVTVDKCRRHYIQNRNAMLDYIVKTK
ncbi:LAMI_0G05798g1_1 [Lachancea mirantina]|uniref:LAMI_0G05798g1_1 n=1 Tax=Lachancea mirantina TaxID=1230905 RepID=A0A1G4K8Y7_9SACH|nr:LAMI_0G05798g1_1 [Lachancea mirantina]